MDNKTEKGVVFGWFLVGVAAIILVLISGIYFFKKQSEDPVIVEQGQNQEEVEVAGETSSVTQKQVETSGSALITVRKVSPELTVDFAARQSLLVISVTVDPSVDDYESSLCFSIVDENNQRVTESDCLNMPKVKNWESNTITIPFSNLRLAPESQRADFWTVEGVHRVKVQVELVRGTTDDYSSESIRALYPLIAKDDTGLFKLDLFKIDN